MTKEEKKAKRREYVDRVLADPFRHKLYLDYFRKRRAKPEIHERTNAQSRARYNKDVEASRSYCRAKYARLYADPAKRAAMNARRRANRHKTNAVRRGEIKYRLIPRWEAVVRDGREDSYLRRTSKRNAALFTMWKNNRVLFDQMMGSRKIGGSK